MAWILLLIAGLLEVAWAIGLKYTQGFTRPGPTLWTLLTMAGSFYCLAQSVRTLPVGTAYAVWTGIGAVGAAVLGMVLLGESRDAARIVWLTVIIVGIIGLKFSTRAS